MGRQNSADGVGECAGNRGEDLGLNQDQPRTCTSGQVPLKCPVFGSVSANRPDGCVCDRSLDHTNLSMILTTKHRPGGEGG